MTALDRRLFNAVDHGKLDAARKALDAGADVNARGNAGETPLHRACEFGNEGRTDVARLLLEHGADVNAKRDGGYTPLHEACFNSYAALARLLLERGADAKSGNGNTPLDMAMQDCPWTTQYAEILNAFREHAPELVMEAWCTATR